MNTKIYMGVTNDKYELPIAIANTLKELSCIVGIGVSGLSAAIKENRECNNKKWRFLIVDIEE